MPPAQQKHWLVATAAVVGIVLICAGLWSAALSNPGRFTLDIRADRQIQMLGLAGFVCTISGLVLLLFAANRTTKFMPPQQKSNTNQGIGAGLVLQLGGLSLVGARTFLAAVGGMFILVSLPLLIWGCMNYAQGKGYTKQVGFLGLLGIFGLIVLIVLPDKRERAA